MWKRVVWDFAKAGGGYEGEREGGERKLGVMV